MDLREQNEQYVGRFFQHDVFIDAYIYISDMNQDGELVWSMLQPFSYKCGGGECDFDSWNEISQLEFEQAFDKITNSWRVW